MLFAADDWLKQPALVRVVVPTVMPGAKEGESVPANSTAGIDVPIVPGIIPVTGYAQIKRFTERCGASIPEHYEKELARRADDPDAVKDLGVAYASLQCADLLAP